jgi:hypothetical protein
MLGDPKKVEVTYPAAARGRARARSSGSKGLTTVSQTPSCLAISRKSCRAPRAGGHSDAPGSCPSSSGAIGCVSRRARRPAMTVSYGRRAEIHITGAV